MRKVLATLALGLPAASVCLAGSVSVYGIIETGVSVQKEKHEAAVTQMASAFDLGSRWGLKGSEDLGNGTSVGFILENGFDPSNGTTSIGGTGAQFGRESILYIKNEKFGRLAFGRTGTLYSGLQSFDMQTGYAFKGGYGLIGWPIGYSFAGNFNRVSNAIAYQSEYINGMRVGLMYSNGIADDSEKWSKNTHYYGAALQYKQGAINSSLAVEAESKTASNGVAVAEDKYIVNYGLEYDLGSFTPMFAYRYMMQHGGYQAHTFGLSAVVPMEKGRVKAAVRYTFGKTENQALIDSADGEDKMTNIAVGVAYEYPLSKRTVIKPFAGYSHSGKAWKNYKPLDADHNAVYTGWQAYVGMHHFF